MSAAVILASFGTSVEEARARDIAPVEQALRESTKLPCRTAYTSPTIRKILARRGEIIPSLEEALDSLAGEEEVFVQPTHLLYGCEYDGMKGIIAERRRDFSRLHFGRPLLAGTEDIQAVAGILDRFSPPGPGKAYLFLGHGTEHFANLSYPALQTAMGFLGRRDILIGTVEGWPGQEETVKQLSALEAENISLSPLMLVAGDHAINDMAGDSPDSWKSRLEREGFAVSCAMRGLGALAPMRELYVRHFRELLAEAGHGL